MLIGICGASLHAETEGKNEKINVNTASVERLTELKGIGPVIAERIVNYRQANGSFSTAEDLMKVKGIGSGTIADIENRIVFKSASD
ncbi:MAG: helix-hairpin-helix domain-containing protein [Desulfobacteraceae bacterium]|nr:helix-hairpin-helix domain-containing protein [Desulfobacteraceae bacterium]